MAYEFDNGDNELLLLGNKSYRPKSFTLKEIIDLGYKDGLYEEGIKEDEVKFKINFTTQNARNSYNGNLILYHPFGQIVVWKKDGTPITVYNIDYNNVYLNNNNFSDEIPNVRFLVDGDGYRYEIIGTKGFNTNAVNTAHTRPCASFGPPMSVGGNYPQCFENFTLQNNTDPNSFYIQTDNPDVKAISIMFFAPPAWSGTTTYIYAVNKLTINGELIYDYDTMSDFVTNEYMSALGINNRFLPRYTIVKNNDDTYTTYKSWMYFLNYPNEINKSLFLLGDTYYTHKEVTLNELIDNGRTDGLFDDAAGYSFNLDLKITQMWNTFNTGEIFPSGALVWDKANNPLLPYERIAYKNTIPVIELIDATFTDTRTTPMRINLKYDKLPNGNNSNYTVGSAFLKNIQTSNGWTTAGKVVPGGAIIVTGGKGNSLNLNYKFYNSEFKAITIDTVCMYDIKYNGINNASSRHCGRVESITHDKVLHSAADNTEWVKKYTRTVKNKIYGARCVFTTDSAFMCFTNITDTKNLIVDPICYIYHAMTDEMITYTLDELSDLYNRNKIADGCYYYDVVNIININIKLIRTFDSGVESIGYRKMFIIDKNSNSAINNFITVAGDTLIGRDDHLYELSTQNTLVERNSFNKSVDTNEGLLVNSNTSFDFIYRTDNPNAKRLAIIPWYSEENVTGKFELDGKIVFNYSTLDLYKDNEFKIVKNKLYGSVYLYDVETKTIKKAWVRITEDGIPSDDFFIYYANGDMGKTSIEKIFNNDRNDGTSPENYIIKYSKFTTEIVSGGAYGGAIYRVYPVIDGKVYYLYSGPVTTSASGTLNNCIFRYTGFNVNTDEERWEFLNKCNTTTTDNIFSIGDESDQFIADIIFTNRYPNSTLYQPTTTYKYPGNFGHDYFLGYNTNSKRLLTVAVTDNNISGYEGTIDIIDSLILIPYHSSNTSGRCATKFSFDCYTGDTIINSATLNVSSYRGWFLTKNEEVEEILKEDN